MSDHEQGRDLSGYKSRLEFLLAKLQEHTRGIEAYDAARRRIWQNVSELVDEYGVTEDTKFVIAAFSGSPTDPERSHTYITRLTELDSNVQQSAGQLIAWLTLEKEITSHPFNPSVRPMTEKNYLLHLGLLPQDAALVVGRRGRVSVPVEKSATIPLNPVYLSEEPLSFDGELLPLSMMKGQDLVRLENNPGIDLASYDYERTYPVVCGNTNVDELLTDKLGKSPRVEAALGLLSARLFEN